MKFFIENDSGSCFTLYHNERSIDLSYSSIVKIKFMDCNRLEKVNLSCNKLTSVPEGLPARLVSLNLSGNLIDCIPENLPDSLEDLDIACNRVGVLPKNFPPSLTVLNIGDNPIETLEGLRDTNVKCLWAFFTCIKSTRHCPIGLEELDISANELTEDDIVVPRSLRELSATSCKIGHIPILHDGLKKLSLELNPIRDMTTTRFPPSLEHLVCPGGLTLESREEIENIKDYDECGVRGLYDRFSYLEEESEEEESESEEEESEESESEEEESESEESDESGFESDEGGFGDDVDY